MEKKKGSPTKNQFKHRPDIRLKAQLASKGKPRPNRLSKKKIEKLAKVEIMKDELIKTGYLAAIRAGMPSVIKAHLKVASNGKASSTQERKLLFQAAGLLKSDAEEAAESMGQLLASLADMPDEE